MFTRSKTRGLVVAGTIAPLLFPAGFALGQPDSRVDSSTVLFEDFSSLPDTPWGTLPRGFWFEGLEGGATARVENGRLLVDATRREGAGCTVWLDRELPEAVEIQFDVHVVESIDAANNMNLMIGFRDPDQELSASRTERSMGTYALYHSDQLEGTIMTYVSNGSPDTARVRVRRVPPFDPIIQEYRGYHARAGHTYRIVIRHESNRMQMVVDGRLILDTSLRPKETTKAGGYLGFRTWNTKLWWDNVHIRRLGN